MSALNWKQALLSAALFAVGAGCWPGPEIGGPVVIDPGCTPNRPGAGGGSASSGGNASGGGSASGGGEASGGGTGNEGPGFNAILTNTLGPSCAMSFCHEAEPPPVAPMSLLPQYAYSSLVNVPSVQEPTLMRVKPFDPEHSYLVIKLKASNALGIVSTRMPLNKPPIDDAAIAEIEAWIRRGAPND